MILKYYFLGLILFLFSCSPEIPKLQLAPNQETEKITTNDTLILDPKLDLIFIVDNSSSMNAHQENLANNIDRFVSAFMNKIQIDYHIGVMTTDMSDTFLNSAICCGRLVGRPRIIDQNVIDGNYALAKNLRVGVSGSGSEKLFDPLVAAFLPPLSITHNKGFLRPEAHLAVIFITDANDQSSMSPEMLYSFLVNLKGSPEKVLASGVIIPSDETDENCPRDSSAKPDRIEKFLALVANAPKNIIPLCSSNFGNDLSNIAVQLTKKIVGSIVLQRIPIVDSIQVWYGQQQILKDKKTGWFYDLSRNAISFGDEIVWNNNQAGGAKLHVTFETAKKN